MEDTKDTPVIDAASAMYEALEQIANMQPGEYYDEMCDGYEDCDTCREMIDIAQDALMKTRGEI